MDHIAFDLILLVIVADDQVLTINTIVLVILHYDWVDTSLCAIGFSCTTNINRSSNGVLIRFRNTWQIICNTLVSVHLRYDLHRLPPHHNNLRRRDGVVRSRVRSVAIVIRCARRVGGRIGRRDRISTGLRRGKHASIANFTRNRCAVSRNRIGNRNRLRRNTCRALVVTLPVKQRRRQRLALPIRHVLAAHHQLLLAGGDHVDGVAIRLRFLKRIAAAVNRHHSVYTGGGGIPRNRSISSFINFYILRKATVTSRVDNLEGDASGRNLVIPCVGICYVHCKFNSITNLLFLDCGCCFFCAFLGTNRKARNVNQCLIINSQLLYFFHVCNVLL